jgi:PPOX class probable F420-dependent enzyme
MMRIPETHKDLLNDDVAAFAFLATIMEDGTPQVTPVWFSWDGSKVLVNSVLGRKKDDNIRRNPNVAIAIVDPKNPYRYMQLRGRVVDITQDGAVDHINQLSHKYNGKDYYATGQPVEERVIYRIEPEKSNTMG